MLGRLPKFDLFAAAAAVIVVAVAALLGALVYVAGRADEETKRHEEAVVANGLNVRIAEIADAAVDYARGNDPAGAVSFGFVLSGRGQVSRVIETQPGATPLDLVLVASTPLVAALRQIEQSRPELANSARPMQSSAVVRIGHRIYVLTATFAPNGARRRGPSPIAITAQEIDTDFLATLTDRLLLDVLTLRPHDDARDSLAHADLTDMNGDVVAVLEWRPRTPGSTLLRSALAPIFVLIAALGGVGFLLYRRGKQAAHNLKASEARATHLAYHDALTGLPNRLLLGDRLGRAVEDLRRRNTPFAVLCIDLDRFKDVNDTFGHAAGDELIRLAAQKISSACRSVDTVARLGGDEFAIVQIGATLDGAAKLADRIITMLTAPLDLSVGRVHIGASIGVTYLTEAVTDAQECLRQADLALYRVKENGRGAFCLFEQEMDATVRYRRALQDDLHLALKNNELQLHYQPQVDGSGTVIGLEALVRWTHPERGPISPTVFVPIAEECGLIDELGLFTMRRAFEDSSRWPDLRIAINLSATQLRLKDFPLRLGQLVAETGVDPDRFELEITEGVLLGDDPLTHMALNSLRELGFSLALDDFGTGYSSLSYLQRYPVNKIKIDRSFITNLGVDRESDAVVAAIVRLARALNLAVIAEGVETNEQRLLLSRAGCQEVQGYLFGRPSPADQIDDLMTAQQGGAHPGVPSTRHAG
jgi:diguanylate cyclase (GGDEF)-like protein